MLDRSQSQSILCGGEQRVRRAFVNELLGRQELDMSRIKPKVSLPDLRQTNGESMSLLVAARYSKVRHHIYAASSSA